jgi:D-inositol-3-phosphate glycosyltransferase
MSFNKYNNRVAIIEPSGSHSGMHYYNFGMKNGLENNSTTVFLFTNSSFIPANTSDQNVFNYFERIWSTKGKFKKVFFYTLAIFKSIFVAKKQKCKVVHLHQFHLDLTLLLTVFICKVSFGKVVLTVHDVVSFRGENLFGQIFRKFLFLMVDKVIVHNTFSYNELDLDKKTKAAIIHHGHYKEFFKKLEINKNTDGLNILFFGLIKETKGLDVLIESLAILKRSTNNFNLTIAGRPWHNDFAAYSNLIAKYDLGDNVKCYLTFQTEKNIIDLYSKSDIIVLPYKRIYQSGVLLKSMSMGRPVLCSDLAPFTELIKDGFNGFVFKEGHPISLANKLFQIYSNKDILNSIIDNASQDLDINYNWKKIGREIKELYTDLY